MVERQRAATLTAVLSSMLLAGYGCTTAASNDNTGAVSDATSSGSSASASGAASLGSMPNPGSALPSVSSPPSATDSMNSTPGVGSNPVPPIGPPSATNSAAPMPNTGGATNTAGGGGGTAGQGGTNSGGAGSTGGVPAAGGTGGGGSSEIPMDCIADPSQCEPNTAGSGGTPASRGSGTVGGSGGSGVSGTGGNGESENGCPVALVGWAAVNADGVATTTGGGTADSVQVSSFEQLSEAVADDEPRVVVVSGTIRTTDGGGFALRIGSNKTLVGANASATIYGGIEMNGVSNVIIRNLNIQGIWPNAGPDDTVASRNSHHIWYDHLNIWDGGDGLLDITNESNYQTVSWSKFWYTDATHDHRLASLNGSGGGDHPEDWDKLKATYHHNWWAELVDQRMPRVMYGLGHQFNNYFNSEGNSYCIGVGSYGAVLIENNYFEGVTDPHAFMYDVYCHITARGNVYDNTTGKQDTGMGGTRIVEGQNFTVVPFTDPPYDYSLDAAEDVPDIVTRCAGPQ